jgi:hypothetical protein
VAPVDATYLTQTANSTLTNEFAIGADPNADRLVFWDDSAGGFTYLTAGTGLSISGTTMTASGFDTSACTNGWVLYKSSGAPCSTLFSFTLGTNEGSVKVGQLYTGAFLNASDHVGDSSNYYVGPNDTNGDYGGMVIIEGDQNAQYGRLVSLYSGGSISSAPTATLSGSIAFKQQFYAYEENPISDDGMVLIGEMTVTNNDTLDGSGVRSVTINWIPLPGTDSVFGIDSAGPFIPNGNALHTDTTTAHTALISAYDVNAAAYVPFVTLTNANAPTFVLAPSGDGTVAVTANLITSAGAGLAVANVGANSCGTTAATIAGGSNSFELTVGATAGTQCRVTFPTTAPTRWNCVANNTTTANLARATPVDTTHVDFLGTFVAGDVVSGTCTPR